MKANCQQGRDRRSPTRGWDQPPTRSPGHNWRRSTSLALEAPKLVRLAGSATGTENPVHYVDSLGFGELVVKRYGEVSEDGEHTVRVLVTGGAGYIGAHVVRALQRNGHMAAVLDDLSSGSRDRLSPDTPLFLGSVLDTPFVVESLRRHRAEGVVHVAAKKAVEESVDKPLTYYRENVIGSHSLLTAMVETGVRRILFSSSAAVYGVPSDGLVTEKSQTAPASPYGWTKLMSEQIIRDTAAAEQLSWVCLRYFNVAGAVDSRLADRGENNLIPRVFRALSSGINPRIFGRDYPTPDGTCIRDYIHVDDVAEAHAGVMQRMGPKTLRQHTTSEPEPAQAFWK
jgi:UDP-glucose 4-epimerase